jgi:hypothetical protein
MRRYSLAVFSLFSFLLFFSMVSSAQLGEVAGQPHFNVSLGGSNSINITVINEATYPLPITVLLPTLTSTDPNAITPGIMAYPMHAVIPAGKELQINITVHMPEGTNKPGYSWSGILQVLTVPNSSSGGGGGASIIEGVAKIVSISATKHVASIWDYIVPIGVVVIIVAAVAGILVARSKGMLGGARKASSKAKAAAARRQKGKKAGSKRGATRPKRRKRAARATRRSTRTRGRRRRR